jgi:tryptophan 2,3-dioxygenase
MEIRPELAELIQKLEERYKASGQDIVAYLEGLLYAEYVNYWDYIRLDTLLTLQNPRTSIPDEKIFIIYHQITELYFKLCLNELEEIGKQQPPDVTFMTERIRRINSYFENLTHSFDIMVMGMEHDQFLKFRMSLLPASGFQSAQYRMIEICSTDLIRLVAKDKRHLYNENSKMDEMFEHVYWKEGATVLESGSKTLTLKQFEEKYTEDLVKLADEYKFRNLWQKYMQLNESDRKDPALLQQLKRLDVNVNINWPLMHYKSAARYLQRKPDDIPATGGTNWQKYLPPRFQKRIFFPAIWNETEVEEWGKGWVEHVVNEAKGK